MGGNYEEKNEKTTKRSQDEELDKKSRASMNADPVQEKEPEPSVGSENSEQADNGEAATS